MSECSGIAFINPRSACIAHGEPAGLEDVAVPRHLADAIVTIERIGLLEQSVRCANGTDPPGVVAAIGPYLPAEMKCVMPR